MTRPWWGLRGWKFFILITLDCWKRHFREKNYMKNYFYLLKLLLKNVEEILFGQILLGTHTAQIISKHVWICWCLTTWKIKILKKWKQKKPPEDIIILHLHNTNDDHMMYGSWDIECDRHNFLSFWTIFCPFAILPILRKCTKNHDHLLYCSWDMVHNGCN